MDKTESPLPQESDVNTHITFSISKNVLFVVIGILTFTVIGLGFYTYTLKTIQDQYPPNSDSQEINDSVSSTTTPQADSKSLSPTTANIKPYYIDLYGLSVDLPADWTITEINRRPEPTEFGNLVRGHDCAEYVIQDPQQNFSLKIDPFCEFSDGGGLELPDDAVKLTESDGEGIARLTQNSITQYVDYGNVVVSDLKGTRKETYYSNAIGIKSDKDSDQAATISLTSTGDQSTFYKVIGTFDRIVLSIVK